MKRLLLAALLGAPLVTAATIVATHPCHHACHGHRAAPARVAVEPVIEARAPDAAPPPVAASFDDATIALRRTAEEVRACYRRADRDAADRLIAASPRFYQFDDAGGPAVTCTYRSTGRSGYMQVCAWRPTSIEGPIAVAIAPGAYGTGIPGVQDLAVMRPQVLVLAPGQDYAVVNAPVACARFQSDSPRNGMAYHLKRFEAGSDIDRLMVQLCAGDTPDEAEAQLAVWITRNGITKSDILHHLPVITFGSGARITLGDADGAARLMASADLNARSYKFFNDSLRRIETAPREEQRLEPTPPPQEGPPATELMESPS